LVRVFTPALADAPILTVIVALAGTIKVVVAGESFVDLDGAMGSRKLTVEVAVEVVFIALFEPDQIELKAILMALQTLEECPCIGHVHEETTAGGVACVAATTATEDVITKEIAHG